MVVAAVGLLTALGLFVVVVGGGRAPSAGSEGVEGGRAHSG